MADYGSIRNLIERMTTALITYINFEKTKDERNSTIVTIDTTIREINRTIEDKKQKILKDNALLRKHNFDYNTTEGQLILNLFDTMREYEKEIGWRAVEIEVLDTYMTKYYEALEGAKGISQSTELVTKQQEYLTIMFNNMRETFTAQTESGFEQRKLEFGALLQRFEFLTDRIRINDVILNKCVDTIKDQNNDIKKMADGIVAKYQVKKVYTCSHCWQEFDSKQEMEEHSKMHIVKSVVDEVKVEKEQIEHNQPVSLIVKPQESPVISDLTVDTDVDPVIDEIPAPAQPVNIKPVEQESVMVAEEPIQQTTTSPINGIFKSSFDDIINQQAPKSDVIPEPVVDNIDVATPQLQPQPNQIFQPENTAATVINDVNALKERKKHFKMLGKELAKTFKYKNQIIEYLIKQNKFSNKEIEEISGASNATIYQTRTKMTKQTTDLDIQR